MESKMLRTFLAASASLVSSVGRAPGFTFSTTIIIRFPWRTLRSSFATFAFKAVACS
jgi:hypothetical protein